MTRIGSRPAVSISREIDIPGVGTESGAEHDNLDARAALFRTQLHERRMLVVLDNARDSEQIRPLLPGNPTSVVVVTSRNRMDDLVIGEGAAHIALAVLSQDESRDLLGRYLGHRAAAEPHAVDALVEHCAGLPLALGIVAVRAAEDPAFSLGELVSELRDERDRLDALDLGGRTGIRSVFSWSYRSLSADAARLFRLLGLPTGPDISLAAVADLAGTSQRDARRTLGELTRSHLLEQHERGRYRFHDLVRAYAAECATHDEGESDRLAAVRRLFDHYLRTSRGIRNEFMPHIQYYVPPPESDVIGVRFEDYQSGLIWWHGERANLLAAIRQAAKLGLDEHVWQLSHSLMPFFHTRSHTADWIASHDLALRATRRLGEREGEAYLLHELGVAHHDCGQYDDSARCREQALTLFRDLGDRGGESDALIGLGHTRIDTDRMTEAAEDFARALALGIEVGDRYDQGQSHFGLGRVHLVLGEFEQAVPRFREALTCYDEVGESYGRGFALNMLGDAQHGAGRAGEAISSYRDALAQFADLGHGLGESIALRGAASALDALGEPGEALDCRRQALAILDRMGHPDADALRASLPPT